MLPPNPVSAAELEAWRIRAKRVPRSGLIGAHLERRKGQSLEFREYGTYHPGDDIRHVDWCASARNRRHPATPPFQTWLLKHFVAEDNLQLVVTVDPRTTLELPERLPKSRVAGWVAEALAQVALLGRERVTLHRPAGRNRVMRVRSGSVARFASELRAWWDQPVSAHEADAPNLDDLRRALLPPTAVWVVISDFYFFPGEPMSALIEEMVRAQTSFRWVLALELDSWPFERTVLGEGPRALAAAPALQADPLKVEITPEGVAEVARLIERNVGAHRARLQEAGIDYLRWIWPATESFNPTETFRTWFTSDPALRRVFEREA